MFAFSFTACDNYEEPNPKPQTNAQEPVLQASDVEVASAVGDQAYDLVALNDSLAKIHVATIKCATLPSTYDFVADAQVSANGFSRVAPVATTVVPAAEEGYYDVLISPDDMQTAFYNAVSKGPKAKEVEVRFKLETKTGAQVAYVGDPDNYYGPYKLTVIPFPSSLVIEDAYYLLGSINGWSVAEAVKFSHSSENVYDDPVFTLKVDITPDAAAGGWWWKVIPQSTYANGDWTDADYSQYGPAENGDEAAEGSLVPKLSGVDPGAGCFKEAGQWLITINMEEGTYSFSSAVDFLYTPGNSNGWNWLNSQLLGTTDYAVYTGYAVLDGEFKFSNAPDWDHINYGAGAGEGLLSTDGGAGNLSVDKAGLYWCDVNTASLTYALTYISTYGIIGDSTPGGWDASTALTSTDNLIWKGTIHLKDGEFKFRANDGWDINLGGDLQNLTQGGDNIKSPGEGDYEITLNLSTLPYSATLAKK